MRAARRLAVLAVVLAAACAASAGPAAANGAMETGIADDTLLLNSGPDVAAQTVEQWKGLGIDRVRIFARWVYIAPGPDAAHAPSDLDPRDADSPGYNWGALDNAIALVTAAGIKPMVTITGSGPLWTSLNPSQGTPRYRPDPAKFADFAHAVATRYKGLVDRYIIWNEPNQPGWLQPQFTCAAGKGCVPESPNVYRELYRAGYAAVKGVDPSAQVLVGALAPRGGDPTKANRPMRPLTFLRALGCVDDRYRRIRTGACRTAQPIRADGLAYHPHGVARSPSQPDPNPDEAAIADLPRLETTLDGVTAHGLLKPRTGGKMPLYLTEFGYQTNPPDRYVGVSLSRQAAWLQQATYVAWRDPRVQMITQYEWRDEPVHNAGAGRKAYASWQSGLLFADGRVKPSLNAFVDPFYVDVRPGRRNAIVWGQVRPGLGWSVDIERAAPGSSTYTVVKTAETNLRGFFNAAVPVTGRAKFRFSYSIPTADGTGVVRFHSPSQIVAPVPAAAARR